MERFANTIIVLSLSYILGLMGFLFKYIQVTFGILIYPFSVYLGLLIPALYFIYRGINQNDLKLPYFKLFIVIEILFIIMELRFFDSSKSEFIYIYYMFVLYTNFIILVNYGTSEKLYRFIVRSSVYIIFLLITLQYAGFLGLLGSNIELTGFFNSKRFIINQFDSFRFGESINLLIHPNGASILAAVLILLLLLSKEKFGLSINRFFSIIIIFFPFLLILLNATRGVFLLITLILFLYYLRKESIGYKSLHIYALILTVIISIDYLSPYFEALTIINRLEEISPNQARANQIKISFSTFLESPIFGVGYKYATYASEYRRSNFSFTQILASNGIFYFIIYMTFLFKMWGSNMNNFIKLSIVIFSFGVQMFYNWALLESLAVLAYVNYYEKRTSYAAKRI